MERPEKHVPYDDWAPIYDVWVTTAPITERNRPFYVERLVGTEGLAVELGVGNGRIAIEAAKRGKAVTGVDSSSGMLALCRARAREAGVADRLTLVRADFRDFELPEPASLVVIPFHSIGHLLTLDDKREGLRHIANQLRPGGRLIFDHFVFDREMARARGGVRTLCATYPDRETAHDTLLWVTATHDLERQTMLIVSESEELDRHGYLLRTKVRRMDFSWLDPDQARALLEETGFVIENAYGCFDESPLAEDSAEQIWVARRPS